MTMIEQEIGIILFWILKLFLLMITKFILLPIFTINYGLIIIQESVFSLKEVRDKRLVLYCKLNQFSFADHKAYAQTI